MKSIYRAIAPILLCTMLFLTACGTSAPPPTKGSPSSITTTPKSNSKPKTTDTTKKTTTQPSDKKTSNASSLKDISGLPPQKGAAFNKYFPNVKSAGYDSTFTQEKTGFAEVKLAQKGTEVARISISDSVTTLSSRNKFIGVKDQISGFPVVAQGKTATVVLVGDRYQVKVMSRASTFTEADRKDLLAEVDLAGLSKLK